MKLGYMCGMDNNGIASIDEILQEIKTAEALGYEQAWMAQVFSTDAITLLSIAGRETENIRLGTAVTPSYPRHPTALALQVLTASAATQGRFELGLGLSHKLVIEDMYGISYAKPASHMNEYLQVLMPLLRGEACGFNGDEFRVHAQMNVPDAKTPVPVLVAALGSKMLEIAGRLADGTTTWMTGPKTLESHIIPSITKAATAAGKPAPRIVAGFPIVLTQDVDAARARIAKSMEMYNHLPSYQRMLEMEGSTPEDVAMVGDEQALRQQLQHLKDIGVTDFNAFCVPVDKNALERTMQFVASEKGALS